MRVSQGRLLAQAGLVSMSMLLSSAAMGETGDAGSAPDAPAGAAPAISSPLPVTLEDVQAAKARRAARGGAGRVEGRGSDFVGSASDLIASDMGLFFGFATLNGREVSSAGNWRTINFKQMPGETMKATLSQRFQRASDIEGAIFSTLATRTVRPLDLKDRRLQLELRGSYLPYGDRFDRPFGRRVTASYADQFNTGIGKIGISLGVLSRFSPTPREYLEAGTNYRPCNSIDPGLASGGAPSGAPCSYNAASKNKLYYGTTYDTFRQERVTEKLDGYFGALQWQPSSTLDINLDVEHSRRITSRYRDELTVSDTLNSVVPIEIGNNGQLIKWQGSSGLDLNAFTRRRDERYTGGGLTTSWHASDRLTLVADGSYSRTYRYQNDTSATLLSNSQLGTNGRVTYFADQSSGGMPAITFATPVDVTDYNLFTSSPAARRGLENRTDKIAAGRLDATYKLDGVIRALKFGIRYSDHHRDAQLQTFSVSGSGVDPANAAAGRANCRISTIVDNFATQTMATFQNWAMYDPTCLFASFAGTSDPNTTLKTRTGGGIHVRERILAGYGMATFGGNVADVPVSGDIGLRVVQTETETRVYRFTANPADLDGVYDKIGPVVDLLPTLNLSMLPTPKLWVRAGFGRTMQRSNIEGLGLRRILQGPAANGDRPRPLRSWNADLVFEYKADKDTSLLLSFNYKLLSGSAWPGDVLIPGGPTLPSWLIASSQKGSYIRGLEAGASHHFGELPAPFNGLTLRASYAYTTSNFKFADPTAIDPANPLYLFTEAAGVPALSKHVASLQADYEIGKLTLGVSYDYRSGYFRPTGLTPNRFLAPNQFVTFNASYDLTKHVQLLFLAANLTNQSESYQRPVADSVGQTAYAGRVFSGAIRLRY